MKRTYRPELLTVGERGLYQTDRRMFDLALESPHGLHQHQTEQEKYVANVLYEREKALTKEKMRKESCFVW